MPTSLPAAPTDWNLRAVIPATEANRTPHNVAFTMQFQLPGYNAAVEPIANRSRPAQAGNGPKPALQPTASPSNPRAPIILGRPATAIADDKKREEPPQPLLFQRVAKLVATVPDSVPAAEHKVNITPPVIELPSGKAFEKQPAPPADIPPPTPSANMERVQQLHDRLPVSRPLTEITLQISRGSETVDVQVRGDAGKVDVAVAANQEALASTLRHDLPSLVEGLHQQGYEATADTPSIDEGHAQPQSGGSDAQTQSNAPAEYGAAGRFEEHQHQRQRGPDWPEEE